MAKSKTIDEVRSGSPSLGAEALWYKGFGADVAPPPTIMRQAAEPVVIGNKQPFAIDLESERFIIDMMERMKIPVGDAFPMQLDVEKHIQALNKLKWRINKYFALQGMSIPDQVQHPIMIAISKLFCSLLEEGENRGFVKSR